MYKYLHWRQARIFHFCVNFSITSSLPIQATGFALMILLIIHPIQKQHDFSSIHTLYLLAIAKGFQSPSPKPTKKPPAEQVRGRFSNEVKKIISQRRSSRRPCPSSPRPRKRRCSRADGFDSSGNRHAPRRRGRGSAYFRSNQPRHP